MSGGDVIYRLERLTLTYSVEEDRLCLAALEQGGQQLVFWLTQRFCRVLIPKLLQWLQAQDACQEEINQEGVRSEAQLLAARQARAEFVQPTVEPVQVEMSGVECREVLLSSVDVGSQEGVLTLLFPVKELEKALVAFNAEQLSQWLAIVHRRSVEASWPLDIWPSWFLLARQQPAKALSTGVH